MPSEFIQRQINRLLEQAAEALARLDWEVVRNSAEAVLRLDAEIEDAKHSFPPPRRDLRW